MRHGNSKWEVTVNGDRGYFEHDTYGEGGGLWFEGKTLVDYDGVGVLPKNVIRALRENGYTVSDDFE